MNYKELKGQLTPVFDKNGKQLKMGERIRMTWRDTDVKGVLDFDDWKYQFLIRDEHGAMALSYGKIESLE